MNDVAADVDGQIATNGAGLSLAGLGGTDQLAGTGDHTIAFPWPPRAGCEIDQTGKEGTLLVDAVVLLSQGRLGVICFRPTSLKPLRSKRPRISPTRPRRTPSGLMAMNAFGHGLRE